MRQAQVGNVTILTKKKEALLEQLTAVAGDPDIVEEALRSLNEESWSPPELRKIVRRILEIRQRRNAIAHAASA